MHAKSASAAKLLHVTGTLASDLPHTGHGKTCRLAETSPDSFQRRFADARAQVVASPAFIDCLRSVLSAREVLGGISHGKFYNEVAAGRLPLTKIGTRSFVAASDLAAYLAASRQPFSAEEVT
jgi:hypothetical protein